MTSVGQWLEPFGVAALAVFAMMSGVWLLSLRLRDVSIVDVVWGPGFLLAAIVYFIAGSREPRQILLLALVAVWALRLASHIYWRSRGEGEDRRYAAMRARRGSSFAWSSLFIVFYFQALLVMLISLPLLAVLAAASGPAWRWSDTLGVGLWCLGFFFEAVGDWQLGRFKRDPANRGQVMDRGLWAWTRHPNYFGDACLWWGYGVLALASPWGLWTWPSVLLMTFFLLKVSGVSLLEQDIAERRPGYRDYVRRTSAFLPWPPSRREFPEPGP